MQTEEDSFDEQWYLQTYPDIRKAVEEGGFQSGREHFLSFGRNEGRAPHAAFNSGKAKLVDQDRLVRLLGYANPFASSDPIADSPALPASFIGFDLHSHSWIFDAAQVRLDPDEIRAALQRDCAPIPATSNREGYFGDQHLAFWLHGFKDFKKLTAIAESYGIRSGSYYDFGGATGRVFRHFYFQSKEWQVSSSDFKIAHVDWNLANYPSEILVFQNMYFPFLPIEDRTFDLISAMSVFTHIDETETSWLLELRRIMKPGAIAIVTVHNDDTWLNLPLELRSVVETYSPELAAMPSLPRGRSVSSWRVDDPYRCNTFHSNDYIRTQWSRIFDIKEILPLAFDAQAAVVLQKRA